MHTITVSENLYEKLDTLDTGYYPIAASEMKTKISSRQKIQTHAGNKFADFTTLDEAGNRCAEINDYAIKWAYSKLSTDSKLFMINKYSLLPVRSARNLRKLASFETVASVKMRSSALKSVLVRLLATSTLPDS